MKLLILFILLFSTKLFGAFSASTVGEIRSTATINNANGCFYDSTVASAGPDYSQQDAAQYNLTGGTSAGAGSTFLHASASTNMNGNGAHITGTNTTSGWYILSGCVDGVSCNTDRAVTTGVGAAMVINIGGSCSLGSAVSNFTDDNFFETQTAGNTTHVKAGTYTIGFAIAVALAGGVSTNIKVIGYNATRGDNPTGSSRPLLIHGANTFSGGTNWNWSNFQMTSTAANGCGVGARSKFVNVKCTNTSTTAGRNAFNLSAGALLLNSEGVSYRGNAVQAGAVNAQIIGGYFHDSDKGILTTGANFVIIQNNIIEGNVTAGIHISGAANDITSIISNTIYGAENKLGTGLLIATGATEVRVFNTIFYGLTTGVSHADAQTTSYSNWNAFNNNTTNRTNWSAGDNDLSTNPNFRSMVQTTGSTATTSGSVLTQSGATFPTFTAGKDFLHMVSGTGVTVGVYGIVSNTGDTITLDIAPGTSATADKVFFITSGHDFNVGSTMKALGFPNTFPGGVVTGYTDVGAIQRREGYSKGRVINR